MKYFNMSRMIKKQLAVVEGSNFEKIASGMIVSNKLGKVAVHLNGLVDVINDNGVSFKSLQKCDSGMLGTSYVLVKNAMKDACDGYEANLKMVGVGFKASVIGKFLRVFVGLSHDICFAIPEGITITVTNDVNINIKGFDRNIVKQFAMTVRSVKKPEPYKGKGIFINNEKILRKEGKKK